MPLARKELNRFKKLAYSISYGKKAPNVHIKISSALKLDQKRSPKPGTAMLYQAKMTHLQACSCMPSDVSVCNHPSPQSLVIK